MLLDVEETSRETARSPLTIFCMPSINLLNHPARIPISSFEVTVSLLVRSPLPSAISFSITVVSLIGLVMERVIVTPKKRKIVIRKRAVIIMSPFIFEINFCLSV
ncbi:hypothetical protein BMS3Abin07_01458 [bacterium BMS3Abin07]|nr:hypothetical protein BMS3Abin07_01458 [bacterium BMS3Abin07]GBE33072.1 hypothetical protein BMS3Bbin05_02007 [bacterium BMS3Bbin05]